MSIFDFTRRAMEQAAFEADLFRMVSPWRLSDGAEAVDRHLNRPARPSDVVDNVEDVKRLYTPGHCPTLANRISQPRRFHNGRLSRVITQHVGGALLDEKDAL